MNVTAFSFILLPLCLFWVMSPLRLLQMVLIAGVFEAAAALTVGGVGLQPGLVPALTFLGFVGLQILLGAHYRGEAQALRDTRPFVFVTVYAVATSFLMPRLFEGTVFVWPQKADPPFVLTALVPTASNLNQDFYLIVNCAFLVAATMFLTKSRLSLASFLRTYFLSGFVVAGVALWQFASRVTGLPYPDSLFYSNPGWAILTAQQIGNVPRINGPFSEPSSLGGYMGAIVCATGWLLLKGHRDRMLKYLFIIGLLTMMLSTSTTGFAVLGIISAGLPVYALVSGSARLLAGILKIGIPLMLLVVVVYFGASMFVPSFNKNVGEVFAVTVDKRQSDSYEGRTSTDVDSLAVAMDTYGLGAGWGSNRSSSLVPGLLAGIGLPGCLGLGWFGMTIMQRVRRARRTGCSREQLFVIDGCCGGLVGFLLAAVLSGPTISSVTFYFLLALLIACPIQVEIDRRAPRDGKHAGMASAPRAQQPAGHVFGLDPRSTPM